MHPDLFIRLNGKYIRISTRNILYVESLRNYVKIVTTTRVYLLLMSLRQLEAELPAACFCRVHRSFLVNTEHIQCFDGESVLVGDSLVPLSPGFRGLLQSRVRILRSETRARAARSQNLQ